MPSYHLGFRRFTHRSSTSRPQAQPPALPHQALRLNHGLSRALVAPLVAIGVVACSAGAPTGGNQGTGNQTPNSNATSPGSEVPGPGNLPVAVNPEAVAPGGVAPGGVAPIDPGTVNQPSVNPAPPEDTPIIGDDPTTPIIGEGPQTPPPEGQLVDGEVCNAKGIEFEKLVPTVLMLVDRSTSMFASNLPNGASPPFGDYPDRWEAVRVAVAGLEPLASEVVFGLSTYTGYNAGVCPEMPQIGTLVPGQADFAQLLAELPSSAEALPPAKSETPTYEAITAGIEVLKEVEIEGPKYLLVITDGEPDTCQVFDPQCGQDAAIGAAQAAYAEGISTFVIGLGADVGTKFLNDLAHAGQGLEVQPPAEGGSGPTWCIGQELQGRGDTTNFDINRYRDFADATYGADGMMYADELYFQPDDVEALQAQLTEVISSVLTCSYEMDTAVVRAQADKGAVRVSYPDGTHEDLAFGGADGWTLSEDNDYTVVIQGTPCDKILSEQVAGLTIEFPCEVRVPLVR